ncbi:acyl carrier protein [Actinomyces vulturis]|uniref:acyl carrier protein n=1 Tax=Actinomyces vulturis TaxID=1857645 RepID=UPI00083292B9|nr:acyl carrier protein [Actinomyces vulturis]
MATVEEIRELVVGIISEESGVDADQITDETKLAEDLDIDSLGLLTIATQVEQELDITIEDSAATSFTTVSDVLAAATAGH